MWRLEQAQGQWRQELAQMKGEQRQQLLGLAPSKLDDWPLFFCVEKSWLIYADLPFGKLTTMENHNVSLENHGKSAINGHFQ